MSFMVSGPEPAASGEWTTASGRRTSSIVLTMSSMSPLLQLQWNRSKVATFVLVGVVDTGSPRLSGLHRPSQRQSDDGVAGIGGDAPLGDRPEQPDQSPR